MAWGSMRNRGGYAWELRIYRGIHPNTGRKQWLTKTVHGTRRYAAVQLRESSDAVDEAVTRAGTIGDLDTRIHRRRPFFSRRAPISLIVICQWAVAPLVVGS